MPSECGSLSACQPWMASWCRDSLGSARSQIRSLLISPQRVHGKPGTVRFSLPQSGAFLPLLLQHGLLASGRADKPVTGLGVSRPESCLSFPLVKPFHFSRRQCLHLSSKRNELTGFCEASTGTVQSGPGTGRSRQILIELGAKTVRDPSKHLTRI